MDTTWAYASTVPASFKDEDVAELTERIIDALETGGYTTTGEDRPAVSLGRLQDDDTRTLYVNTTTDPGPVLTQLTTNLAAVSKLTQEQRDLATRLEAFVDNPSPTQVQSVGAIKDLIRALSYVWRQP